MGVPLPSPESLAHRARLASLISELRPTRFRAPLTRLLAHRIPTLWTLYRGIMREAPTDTIRSHMREFFRSRRAMREQGDVTRELKKAYKWMEIFRKAKAGDEHFTAVCQRYSRMIEGTAIQARADSVFKQEIEWIERMRTRPIMTGGYIKPTFFNKPLPRLQPQPMHITGMIVARRKARLRRLARFDLLQEQKDYLHFESSFEYALAASGEPSFERVYSSDMESWRAPLIEENKEISKGFQLEKIRTATPYPPELLEQIRAARREKIANKTRERERERRGEMTKRLLRQMRQRPPAHRLAQMSAKARRMDIIARGASEVGYVAKVKRALGHKLRDPNAWQVELGQLENREMLDRLAKEIEEENARRRSLQEARESVEQLPANS
ncbi:hypothetical protein GY45DRAFT_1250812 [Cubamyces sp. BRFM 1775]|nr:hypothetical protein GY45DRAFT_1250812 [Cubamyces sp. BRFM 1775]